MCDIIGQHQGWRHLGGWSVPNRGKGARREAKISLRQQRRLWRRLKKYDGVFASDCLGAAGQIYL